MSLRGRTFHDAEKRVRTGLVVLIVGVVLLLSALALMMFRTPPPDDHRIVQHTAPEPAPIEQEEAARSAVLLMSLGGVLVATLLAASYALFRVTRRFATREPPKTFKPTATEDVWSMHKLAEESADGPEDEP